MTMIIINNLSGFVGKWDFFQNMEIKQNIKLLWKEVKWISTWINNCSKCYENYSTIRIYINMLAMLVWMLKNKLFTQI